MKEKLKKILAAKQEQRAALNNSMIECDNIEERKAIGETLAALAKEIEEIEAIIAELDEPAADGGAAGEGRAFSVLATMQTRSAEPATNTDPFDTHEYRTAFMEFCARGTEIPQALRANAVTTTSDAGAVIPTTLLKEIVKEVKSYGGLFEAVRHLNVQGGVQIPILSLKPTATWIGETTPSETKKLQANNSISFSYFGLECKIAQSLLVNVTTLDEFQQLFIELAAEAIAQALDIAIINGKGGTQPTGVTVDARVPAANKITLSAEDFNSWSAWKKKVFGKMKKSYRNGIFFMAQSTFDGYIDGMTDINGQPIGRVNYGIDGAETYRFGGKTVETVEDDVIKAYDDAAEGDIVAVFFNPKDYGINSNMQITVVKWTDHDTNEVKNKAIIICDGKLIDANGVLIIKKGAAAAAAAE